MKILFLTARFPYPPDRGDRLNAYHLLRALADRHRVTLLSFVDGREPGGGRATLEALCERIETVQLSRRRSWMQAVVGMFSADPSQVSYYRSRAMAERVETLGREGDWDLIFVQLFRMAPFAAAIPSRSKVLFLTDSIALALERRMRFQPGWQRLPLAWERARVSRFEVGATRSFRENWVVSHVDAQHLAGRGAVNVHVVAHGVDERLFEIPLEPRTGDHVTFLGNLGVPHNVDAATHLAHDIWPGIRRQRPAATLELAGADPVVALRRFHGRDGILVTGAQDDLVALWSRASVLLAPLRFSTGIQNKVLEAMAAGVPVVTTPEAAEGIGAREGEHLLIGGDPASLVTHTVSILRDPAGALAMAGRARCFVRERFSWETQVRRLEDIARTARQERA